VISVISDFWLSDFPDLDAMIRLMEASSFWEYAEVRQRFQDVKLSIRPVGKGSGENGGAW